MTAPSTLRPQEIAAALVETDPDGKTPPAGALLTVIDGDRQLVSVAGSSGAEPMTERHVHDLASVSKILTTLTLQRLFSQAIVNPVDTLERFYGEAAGHYRDVTLEDLLRHRSGMRPWWPLYLLPGDPIETVLSLEPHYPHRTRCVYSDLGMQTLGDVIARATGMPFAQAVRELVLDVIGADTVTAGAPYAPELSVSGGWGDAVEREMIETGMPYRVSDDIAARASIYAWREHLLRGEVGDCNAFHAFGGVAGHAGWFADATGLRKVAEALVEPSLVGVNSRVAEQLTQPEQPQPEGASYQQCRGARVYNIDWNGEQRAFLAHPGFTGTFVAASAATASSPRVIAVMLTNRLFGTPPPRRTALVSVDGMWRRAMRAANCVFRQEGTGEQQ